MEPSSSRDSMTKIVESKLTANMIVNQIGALVVETGHCSIMLTGGRSAEQLYLAMARLPTFTLLHDVSFWFGDERCVPPDHPDSNYAMVMRTLFTGGVPSTCHVYRMKADQGVTFFSYESQLPASVDILLLSVGEDGHVASLFPSSPALFEAERKVLPVIGPKPPFQRLTITPPVIQAAKSVYVLAIGDEKRRKYEEALLDPKDISSIPARLVLDRTWIFKLDEEIDLCSKF